MSQRDEFVQCGYCGIPGFLSAAEAASWLERVEERHSVLHRGAPGDRPGERVVVLIAFDPAGAKPRPMRDWIARHFNY